MSEEPQYELRLLETDDAKALNFLFKENKDSFKEYFPETYKQTKTIKASKALIEQIIKLAEEKKSFYFGLFTSIHPELVGLVILKEIDLDKGEGEIAYCLAKRFRGRGWISEAVELVADYGFVNHNIHHYKIITHNSNEKSIEVAQRSGFIWHSTLEKEFKPLRGKAQDMELYVLKK
ncbi:GNAT family N-acetyltransferase [Leeuwenhoekiella polynyae]|uniref:Ribosomal-protein-alanine N-acetyltransferase n=1 Tax=Leeuwenhoekiella polynyae TaxID=1550906 RepID=A0A4Q0PH74_9FLAO|nr:GNAT family N-acetyltransferase [Leeuwenhoekiella polynyae]RXG26349.1 ribosomal-protein-alanine N-acetyltransferase [Leeuwenhoekiella polynyae]